MNKRRTLAELLAERDSIEIADSVDFARLIVRIQALERAIERAKAEEQANEN